MLLTRVPASYLRWMANEEGMRPKWKELAMAEIGRRGHKLPTIELSGHAIDNASLRVRKTWHLTARPGEGLYSWLIRVTEEAISLGEHRKDKIIYLGMKFVVQQGDEFPILKTIMPK